MPQEGPGGKAFPTGAAGAARCSKGQLGEASNCYITKTPPRRRPFVGAREPGDEPHRRSVGAKGADFLLFSSFFSRSLMVSLEISTHLESTKAALKGELLHPNSLRVEKTIYHQSPNQSPKSSFSKFGQFFPPATVPTPPKNWTNPQCQPSWTAHSFPNNAQPNPPSLNAFWRWVSTFVWWALWKSKGLVWRVLCA